MRRPKESVRVVDMLVTCGGTWPRGRRRHLPEYTPCAGSITSALPGLSLRHADGYARGGLLNVTVIVVLLVEIAPAMRGSST